MMEKEGGSPVKPACPKSCARGAGGGGGEGSRAVQRDAPLIYI